MKSILFTRFIHLKRHWMSLMFWLAIPLVATIVMLQLAEGIKDDTKVPVGIVLEEETAHALNLVQSIEESPLLRVFKLHEQEALRQLEKHELDSVFIINKGYEQAIQKVNRQQLITGYQSNLSFAYTPVKEMIVSLVQADIGRSKAAYVVADLSEQYNNNQRWTWDEIIETSQLVQEEENLLHSRFTYHHDKSLNHHEDHQFINAWHIWLIFSVLTSLFIFDWMIKERAEHTKLRFIFLKMSHATYLLGNLFIYILIFFIMDTVTYFTLDQLDVADSKSLGTVLSLRIMLSLLSFLIALCFRKPFTYYSFSLALTLFITIGSGAIFPVEELINHNPGLTWLSPFHAFLSGQLTILWTIILLIVIFVWYVRKEKKYA